MRFPKFWNTIASMLDRIPSAWGLPLLVVLAVLMWVVALKLFGL